jgi:hypothetical protein
MLHIRWVFAIAGFKAKFYHWPTRITVNSRHLEYIQSDGGLTPERYEKLLKWIRVETDDEKTKGKHILVGDDQGNELTYNEALGEALHSGSKPGDGIPETQRWLEGILS